jgi:hypothetical protein
MSGRLIGLVGQARAGKSTVADVLVAFGWHERPFAGLLKSVVAEVFGLPISEVLGHRGFDREAIREDWGLSTRQILQQAGQAWRDVHPDVWVRANVRQIRPMLRLGGRVVVSDVRYPNEAAALRELGGELYRVVRPGLSTMDHPSETLQAEIEVDGEIDNSASLDALRERARWLAIGGRKGAA